MAPIEPGHDKAHKDRKEADKARRRLRKDILRLVVVIGVFVVAGYLLGTHVDALRATLNPPDNSRDRFLSYLVFLGFGSLVVSFGFPRIWLCGVAGSLYGAAVGAGVGLAVSVLGALGPYLIGRSVLGGVVRRQFGAKINSWAEKFRRAPFRFTLTVRLIPGTNATVTSLVCGACKVGIGPYLAATALGYVPTTVAFAMLGKAAIGDSKAQWILAALLLVASIFIPWLLNKGKAGRDVRGDEG